MSISSSFSCTESSDGSIRPLYASTELSVVGVSEYYHRECNHCSRSISLCSLLAALLLHEPPNVLCLRGAPVRPLVRPRAGCSRKSEQRWTRAQVSLAPSFSLALLACTSLSDSVRGGLPVVVESFFPRAAHVGAEFNC